MNCAIAGCGDEAETVYYGLCLCDTCLLSAYAFPEQLRTNTALLEDVLMTVVNRVSDDFEWNVPDYLVVTTAVRGILLHTLWPEKFPEPAFIKDATL